MILIWRNSRSNSPSGVRCVICFSETTQQCVFSLEVQHINTFFIKTKNSGNPARTQRNYSASTPRVAAAQMSLKESQYVSAVCTVTQIAALLSRRKHLFVFFPEKTSVCRFYLVSSASCNQEADSKDDALRSFIFSLCLQLTVSPPSALL